MIDPMDWIGLLIALVTGAVTATGVVIGIRVQLQALKESTTREIDAMRITHWREIELLQVEATECRTRIDNLLSMLARNAKQLESD